MYFGFSERLNPCFGIYFLGEESLINPAAEWMSLLDPDRKSDTNSHRSFLDIIADILEACNGETRKTHLMFRCNLAFRQLKHYLDFLLVRNLLCTVAEDSGPIRGFFKTTDKGKDFLKAYKSLKALMN
jgi:predicted transcriptional regulator